MTSVAETSGYDRSEGENEGAVPVPSTRPYHLLARPRAVGRVWAPPLEALIVVATVLLTGVVLTFAWAIALLISGDLGSFADEESIEAALTGSVGGLFVTLLGIVVMIPAVLLAVWACERRSWRTLLSVEGRLRWGWLGRCLVAATAFALLVTGLDYAATGGADPELWPGWSTFAGIVALAVLLVPLQAAAEEFAVRGWLSQALGMWVRNRWVIIAVTAVAFTSLHVTTDPGYLAVLLAFGVAFGWLTLRTGGLEAGIAYHVAWNSLGIGIGAVEGFPELGGDVELGIGGAIVSLVITGAYVATVEWQWRRRHRKAAGIPQQA